MTYFRNIAKGNNKKHNTNWPKLSAHLDKILMTGVSLTGKSNASLNLINH